MKLDIPDLVLSTRKKLNLSQEDFGRILGRCRYAVWSWEKNKARPSSQTLEIITALAKIPNPPPKNIIQNAFIIDGAALGLYILLKSVFEKI